MFQRTNVNDAVCRSGQQGQKSAARPFDFPVAVADRVLAAAPAEFLRQRRFPVEIGLPARLGFGERALGRRRQRACRDRCGSGLVVSGFRRSCFGHGFPHSRSLLKQGDALSHHIGKRTPADRTLFRQPPTETVMNIIRTAMLLAFMTALFMAVGYLIGGSGGMMIAFLIAAGMNLFSYWNADKMVLRMHHARRGRRAQRAGILRHRARSRRARRPADAEGLPHREPAAERLRHRPQPAERRRRGDDRPAGAAVLRGGRRRDGA